MQKPLKIGHQGARSCVAENTINSITKALKLEVDAMISDNPNRL